LPSIVNAVNDSAFWGCTNITEFIVNSYLFNFNVIVRDMNITNLNLNYNGKLPKIQIINLENVTLSGITSIDDDAFALCINLTNITLSQQLTSISNNLFYGCKKLLTITLPNSSLLTIETQAFQDCSSLTEFNIPVSVNTFGNKIFQGCAGLNKITINKEYPNLAYVLYGLDNPNLNIDLNYTGGIPNGTFYNKNGIQTVTIRNTISKIGKSVFESCNNLTGISFDETSNVKILDNKAFYNCINLQVITIPQGVTQIGDYAFSICTSLQSIIIPASVKTIGTNAFSGCRGLIAVSFVKENSALQSIGEFAFKNCFNLVSIVLPSGFIIINENIFKGCIKLTSILR
jgi:hypothetical protein